jgi:type I restriction enzyme S subunit
MGNDGWINKRFDQCAELIRETVDPKELNNVPYIGLEHIAQESLCLVGYGTSDDVNSAKSRFKKGDILFGKLRPYFRKVVIAPFDGVCSTDIWVVRSKPETDKKFLFYWMASHEFIEESTRSSEGTRMPRAQWEFVSRIERLVPQQSEQRAIGNILGALDDKIELNRQMCKTLEETAQAIFKSWFVDFDPVHDKVAGKHPEGLKPEIAALFPDSFVDSELGKIPKKWSVRAIGEMIQVLGGGTPSTKDSNFWINGVHPFCTPKDMSSLSVPLLLSTERKLTDDGIARISSGQLPLGTVLLSSRAPIGYLAVTEIPVSINQGIIAMVCNEHFPNYYALHWTRTNLGIILSKANGSTFLEISKSNFRLIKAIVPTVEVLNSYMGLVEPLYSRIESMLLENQLLITIRDELLPKLISGDLRINCTERILERGA